MPRTALIVGAGIGGLSAGIALQRAGWNVRIFERAATTARTGFRTWPRPECNRRAGRTGRRRRHPLPLVRADGRDVELRRPSGTLVKRADVPLAAALGGRMAIALRPALHGALLDAVGLDTIAVGKEAAGFQQSGRSRDSAADQWRRHRRRPARRRGWHRVGHPPADASVRTPPRSSRIVAVRGAVHGALHHLRISRRFITWVPVSNRWWSARATPAFTGSSHSRGSWSRGHRRSEGCSGPDVTAFRRHLSGH